ncbi:TetR/AcrR family transcriptional regulator [Ferrimicrobium sp.]|uniref:TetR/AcrR family transcriptional regulator n=2 Tax=Ferrimicrobium sp. TaxID=2926050 RepID=UPI002638DB28|nr:TetR/AcrR family transcriptional regulator [Ferrimicrobium sp.]
MPKIMAPTVKEHHAQRRQALLDAAKESLLNPTIRSVNFEAVGPRAGLRRNSVYLYFPSENHLALELADDVLPGYQEQLVAAMKRHREPREQITGFAKVVTASDARLAHEVLRNLENRDRTPEIASKVKEYYLELSRPLVEPLKLLKLTDPDNTAVLLFAMLSATQDIADKVIDAKAAIRRALAVVDAFIPKG